jgi:hypothetical protein
VSPPCFPTKVQLLRTPSITCSLSPLTRQPQRQQPQPQPQPKITGEEDEDGNENTNEEIELDLPSIHIQTARILPLRYVAHEDVQKREVCVPSTHTKEKKEVEEGGNREKKKVNFKVGMKKTVRVLCCFTGR